MGFKVYEKPCKNCLFSKDRIVSDSRAMDVISDCVQNQTHFVCHKASMRGEEVCCNRFYHEYGHISNLARIAQRLGAVEMVPLPDAEKLIPYRDLEGEK